MGTELALRPGQYEITSVPFGDTDLPAVFDGRTIYVPMLHICECLGLDFSNQLKRLKKRPWARMVKMTTARRDGKPYAQVMLDLRTFPMWMGLVNPESCAEHAREVVLRYQTEAVEVLSQHFFPQFFPTYDPDDDVSQAIVTESTERLRTRAKVLADRRDLANRIQAADEELRKQRQEWMSGPISAQEVASTAPAARLPAPVVAPEPEEEWPPFMTAQGYARTIGIHNLTDGQLSLIGRKLAAYSREHDHPMGEQKRIDGPVKTYLTRDVLMVHEELFRNPPPPASKKPTAEAA